MQGVRPVPKRERWDGEVAGQGQGRAAPPLRRRLGASPRPTSNHFHTPAPATRPLPRRTRFAWTRACTEPGRTGRPTGAGVARASGRTGWPTSPVLCRWRTRSTPSKGDSHRCRVPALALGRPGSIQGVRRLAAIGQLGPFLHGGLGCVSKQTKSREAARFFLCAAARRSEDECAGLAHSQHTLCWFALPAAKGVPQQGTDGESHPAKKKDYTPNGSHCHPPRRHGCVCVAWLRPGKEGRGTRMGVRTQRKGDSIQSETLTRTQRPLSPVPHHSSHTPQRPARSLWSAGTTWIGVLRRGRACLCAHTPAWPATAPTATAVAGGGERKKQRAPPHTPTATVPLPPASHLHSDDGMPLSEGGSDTGGEVSAIFGWETVAWGPGPRGGAVGVCAGG